VEVVNGEFFFFYKDDTMLIHTKNSQDWRTWLEYPKGGYHCIWTYWCFALPRKNGL
jgi:hypothetical protein